MPAYEKKPSLKQAKSKTTAKPKNKTTAKPKKRVGPATPQSRANKIKNEKLRNDVPMGARTFASSQNSNGARMAPRKSSRKTKRG